MIEKLSDDELIDLIDKFSDFLSIGTVITDALRYIGWIFVKGLSFILDGIENIANDLLFLKAFYKNEEIVDFVTTMRPLLVILLAFSLLYAGYLLIFQKKFNREGMAINIFVALSIVALLSVGMDKANEFTDEAIDAIDSHQLYDEESGTVSQNIIKRNLTDVLVFDGNDWETTDLDVYNEIPLNKVDKIGITEKIDKKRDEIDISSTTKQLSEHDVMTIGGEPKLMKLKQGKLDLIKEHYYRYDLNWVAMITTLIVMAFTLISIAYKLARLSFEMAFNYILANIVAPIDVHDGQKTKKILVSIFNTFVAIILIFLSMKVYIIGTSWLADSLSGMAYLIGLIAFSVAVIDGPNIVEKLFGIDAGLKSGLGMLMATYGAGKVIGHGGKVVGQSMNKAMNNGGKGKNDVSQKASSKSSKANSQSEQSTGKGSSVKSPNDKDNKELNSEEENKGHSKSQETTEKNKDANKQQSKANTSKVPSPNDSNNAQKQASKQEKGSNDVDTVVTDNNNESVSSASETSANTNKQQPKVNKVPSPNDSNNTQKQASKQKQTNTVQRDNELDVENNVIDGNTKVNQTDNNVGSNNQTSIPNSIPSDNTTNSSHNVQKQTDKQRQTNVIQRDNNVDVENNVVDGNTRINQQERKRPTHYEIPKKNKTIHKDK